VTRHGPKSVDFPMSTKAMSIEDSWFVRDMVKATSDMWLKGWHERNGGNLRAC
jgi:hypothetical protein